MTSGRRRFRFTTGRIGSAALILLCIAGVAQAKGRNPMKIPGAQYEPVTWAAIEGWADDDHEAAFLAFLNSCKAILRGSRDGQLLAALYKVCERATNAKPHKLGEARLFFEQNFRPVRISPLGTPDGFLTGYYEPIAEGTRERTGNYEHPLYRKPPSLIAGGQMQVASAASGKKKARKRRFVPFYERASIEDGILAGRNLEICWLRDPIDSFFAHIQGSVRVLLDDGKLLRLNYQAANGHPYYAVGRWLIDRKIISKDEMSMDRIRQWMERNPKEGDELRRMNKSYVFFRETDLTNDQEPIGAQGISLTPGRSIAVDRKLHIYGTPFFISAMLPIETEKPETPFRRLMIAQDTGGAIVGPARADIYFGAGDEAGSVSGRLRHNGRFVMLMPKEVDPSADSDEVPLPRPRPPIPVAQDKPAETPAKTVAVPSEPAKPQSAKPEPAKPEAKPDAKPETKPPVTATKQPAKTAEKTPEKKADKTAAEKKPKQEAKSEAKSEAKAEAKSEAKAEAKAGAKAGAKTKPDTKTKPEIKVGPKHDPQS